MSVSSRGHRRAPHNPNNTRIRELSRIARHLYSDDNRDYVLPETAAALATALITHLHRAGPQHNSKWLFEFCKARAPWLDPNEIDLTKLKPEKAQPLGIKIGLTAELRARLRITTIRPCDQTPEQFKASAQERRRQRDREYRRRKRAAEGCMRRADWIESHAASRTQPWLREGISRPTWYRRRNLGAADTNHHADDSTAERLAQTVETGASTRRKIVARRRTYLTVNRADSQATRRAADGRSNPPVRDWRSERVARELSLAKLFEAIDKLSHGGPYRITALLEQGIDIRRHFDDCTLVRVDQYGRRDRMGDHFEITPVGFDTRERIKAEYRKAA